MQIVWLNTAFADIERLDAFLRPSSPVAADRMYAQIQNAVRILKDFPNIGRLAPDIGAEFRELMVPFSSGGYVVLYFVEDAVLIARVRHQREDDYSPIASLNPS
jgi:plasmid stabilization system protein ParE